MQFAHLSFLVLAFSRLILSIRTNLVVRTARGLLNNSSVPEPVFDAALPSPVTLILFVTMMDVFLVGVSA